MKRSERKPRKRGRKPLGARTRRGFEFERSHLWQHENEREPAERPRGRADRAAGGKESFTTGGSPGGHASALTTHANMRFSKKRAPFPPFPMNSLGNPQIRSLKPYIFSAFFRLGKPGAAKSLSTWTWSGFAGVGLRHRPHQRAADERSAGGLPGVDHGQCSNRMNRERAIWRSWMPRLHLRLAPGASTPLMGKTAHLEPRQPRESTGPKSTWQPARSRRLPQRLHHSMTINQQELP
jgi:hypothetical protein